MCESFIFFAGLYYVFTGRVRIGQRVVIGNRARLVGGALILPLVVDIIMIFVLSLNPEFSQALQNLDMDALSSVATVEVLLVFAALIAAAVLVLTAPESEITSTKRKRMPYDASTPQPATFPSVLTVDEAARYLRISESDVLQLIDEGRITAARIGGDYRIARVVLDELLQPGDLS
ncbi:MAG: helix-turn-helix domain-containing protein [Anaerolineaceae bacterium]|nr:helix-turn-helix domain-containing protein [Anaerolineaceae bacterium]